MSVVQLGNIHYQPNIIHLKSHLLHRMAHLALNKPGTHYLLSKNKPSGYI